MQIHEFIALIAAEAKAWTEARRGTFRVATTPLDPFIILGGGQHTGFCVVVDFDGDRPAGASALQDMTDLAVAFYVGHAMDLRNDPGAALYKPTPAGVKPLMQQLDELRGRMMTCVFHLGAADDDSYAEYQGAQKLMMPGTEIPMPAMKFTLSWNNRVVTDEEYRFLNEPVAAPAPSQNKE
jgi:hypothetical protein